MPVVAAVADDAVAEGSLSSGLVLAERLGLPPVVDFVTAARTALC